MKPETGYLYSFDLKDFEAGQFTATRYPQNCAVGGDWVCFAKDDAHALELARKAAFDEWSAPDTRRATDFDVEFFDSVRLRAGAP